MTYISIRLNSDSQKNIFDSNFGIYTNIPRNIPTSKQKDTIKLHPPTNNILNKLFLPQPTGHIIKARG